ncbi:MAG: RNA-binding protein [Cyanobacteria bacterium P01_A01_bin.123]
MSVRIYVGNLSKDLERQELEALFEGAPEEIVSIKLISDRKTGKCRGFGFVTVKTDEQADAIVDRLNGQMLQETPLKVEKALPRSKSTKAEGEEGGAPAPSNNRRKGNKGGSNNNRRSTPASSEAAQPDPRWAGELAKLKEMLATQTASS